MKKKSNDKRKILEALINGNIQEAERMKKILKRKNNKILLASFDEKKEIYFIWNDGSERNPFTREEFLKLEKDHEILLLTKAPGEISGSIATSEEEVIQRMKDAGEWKD